MERKKNIMLFRLAGVISAELMVQTDGIKYFDNMLPIYRHFQEYMYEVAYFGNKCIPFHEWEDLAKENVELLQNLIKEGKFGKHKKDKRYLDLGRKYLDRNEKLVKKYERLAYPDGC